MDLSGVWGAFWTLPSSVVAGKSLSGYASVVVSNLGSVALPSGQKVSIVLQAHDTTDAAKPDITLATLSNQSVSGLKPNQSMTFNVSVNRPGGLPAGNYRIQAILTPVPGLTESRTDNNLVTQTAAGASRTILSAPAMADLSGTLGTYWTLPSSVVAGKPLSGYASVVVSNLGNVALPTGQKISIQLVARDTTDPSKPEITLATVGNLSVGGLGSNRSMTFNVSVKRPGGLPADNYQIQAILTPAPGLTESRTDNNLATRTAAGAARTILSVPAFTNLGAVFGTNWTLPRSLAAGRPLAGLVTVVMVNRGDVPLPSGQKMNILLLAHDTTDPSKPDIPLATMTYLWGSGLGTNASKMFYLRVNRPRGLPADGYQIQANITILTGPQTDTYLVVRDILGNTLDITAS
jgi:hypothetical protein